MGGSFLVGPSGLPLKFYVYMCVYMFMSVWLRVEARSQHQESFSITFHIAFQDRFSHWTWNSQIQPDGLPAGPRHSPVSASRELELQTWATMPSFQACSRGQVQVLMHAPYTLSLSKSLPWNHFTSLCSGKHTKTTSIAVKFHIN